MANRHIQLDQLDYDIIQLLHADARVSASEIARATGANERTIRKRIDRLIEEKVFRLTAILDPTVFGYVTAADILLEADPAQEENIVQRLSSMPEITYRVAHGPDIGVVAGSPAFLNSEKCFCCYFAGLRKVIHESEQRVVHFGKIGGFGTPVIFFGVDVDGVVAAPRRTHVRIPQSLQIGRNAGCTRTGNQ